MEGLYDVINKPIPEYDQWVELSHLPRSLYAGTRKMREGGFLPRHPLETDAGYKKRIEQSFLLNVFRKTIGFLAGQVFQKGVIVNGFEYEDDVDRVGNPLSVFAKRVFSNGLANGVAHILVDAPRIETDRPLSLKEEKELGIRPYMVEIDPLNVIGWQIDEFGNPLQVRILETIQVPYGTYGVRYISRIRVLYPGRWELWEDTSVAKDINPELATKAVVRNASTAALKFELKEKGTFSFPGIPLITFIPGDELTPFTGLCALEDLAWLNLEHYQSSSDQRNILSVARVPILFGRHIELGKMPVGVSEMIVSEDDNADIKYVEIQGNSINAGAADLKELESKMAMYGLQQLIPRTGSMTATEKALTSKETLSNLGSWAVEFSLKLEQAINVFNEMAGKGPIAETPALNYDYTIGILQNEQSDTLIGMKKEGILSAEIAFEEFQRRGIVDSNLTWEEVEASLEKQAQGKENDLMSIANGLFGGTPPQNDEPGNEDNNV